MKLTIPQISIIIFLVFTCCRIVVEEIKPHLEPEVVKISQQ